MNTEVIPHVSIKRLDDLKKEYKVLKTSLAKETRRVNYELSKLISSVFSDNVDIGKERLDDNIVKLTVLIDKLGDKIKMIKSAQYAAKCVMKMYDFYEKVKKHIEEDMVKYVKLHQSVFNILEKPMEEWVDVDLKVLKSCESVCTFIKGASEMDHIIGLLKVHY